MAKFKLKNKSNREFFDISDEEWREYCWDGGKVHIEYPQYLSISSSGHYILDINVTGR